MGTSPLEKSMKRILIGTILLVIGIHSSASAKTYDLSQISQVKLATEYSDDATVDEMDTITFGSYPQSDASGNTKEPIEWIVLDKQGDKAFVLSKYILDCKQFSKDRKTNWEVSLLRNWLNNNFLNKAFDGNDQKKIIMTNINSISLMLNDRLQNHEIKKTSDKIFCLGKEELDLYFGPIKIIDYLEKIQSKKILTYGTNYAKNQINDVEGNPTKLSVRTKNGNSSWWLRDGQDTRGTEIEIVNTEYYTKDIGAVWAYSGSIGVRPALWVNISGLQSYNANSNASNANNTDLSKNVSNGNSAINNITGGVIAGLPSHESELRSDNHFYLDNNMQKSTWVYYRTYYYHVDGSGNIQKNQWIELRYVGEDGRMYRGRQTPDGKWVGDDGLVVDAGADLSKSLTIEAAEPDSWYKTQSGLWYYFENDRTTTKKGWFTDKRDNQTYYLDPQTGIMAVGWTKINGSEYYFNESHDNEPNWYETGGGFYESYGKKTKAYGSMFKNETTPDGKKVGADGKLIK